MQVSKQITADIELAHSLKSLAQAYEEIAVMKMQKVRNRVLNTRNYIMGLSEIFADVRYSYRRQVEALMERNKKKGGSTFSTGTKNGKSVAVLISTNAKLSGSVVRVVFSQFLNYIQKSKDDLIIVGRVGKDMYDQYHLNKPYQYFVAPEGKEDNEATQPIVDALLQYETVNVFHGRFINLINQEVTMSNITGDMSDSMLVEQDKVLDGKRLFLFEPSLDEIFHFFEVQIMAILFRQTIHESGLATLGSRITAMEEATINIEKHLSQLKANQLKMIKALNNKKQLQMYAGMSLWNCR